MFLIASKMSFSMFCLILFIYFSSFEVRHTSCETLNIGFESEYDFEVTKEVRDGMVVKTFLPNTEDNITKVVDEREVIWESNDPSKVLGIFRLFTLDNKHQLAYMRLNSLVGNRTRHLQKLGDRWSEITDYAFRIIYRRLWRERVIDVSRPPHPQVCSVSKHNLGGLPARIITPQPKFVVTNVEDDFYGIWSKANAMEKCTCVIVHGHKGNPRLVSLHISDLFKHTELFYEKTDQGWFRTLKRNFYATLERLDEEEERSKNRR